MSEKRIFVGIYENGLPIHIPLNVGDIIVNASGRELATYNEAGLLPDNRLPPLAIKDTFVVSSEMEMLSLIAQTGDIAIRTDLSETYILRTGLASNILNWTKLATPIDSILTVFGRTGHISAEYGDYHASQILMASSQVISAPDVQSALEYLAAYKSQIGHTHNKSDILDFGHTHLRSEITDFAHTHELSDLVDFDLHTHTKSQITDFGHTHIKEEITNFAHTHPQNESHLNPDTDINDESIHHTLGINEFQAAKGNHLHDPISIGAVPLSFMGAGNGVATLNGLGKIPDNQIPKIAITDTFPVNNQEEMLALVAETGDIAIRLDIRKCFILKAMPANFMFNWEELIIPLDLLLSFNGRLGHIIPQYADYSAEQISISQYPPNIQTTNVRDALYSLADKIHLPNTDRFLNNIPTKKLYLDSSNSENYVPNGTISKPFKNFSQVIAFAQTYLYSKFSVIVNSGTYNENISINGLNIDIIGSGNSCEFTGIIEYNGICTCTIDRINSTGRIVINNSSTRIFNSKLKGILNISNCTIDNCLISGSMNDDPLIQNNGSLILTNSIIINHSLMYAITSSSRIEMMNCLINTFNIYPAINIINGFVRITSTNIETNQTKCINIENCTDVVLSNIITNGEINLNDNSDILIGVITRVSNAEIINDINASYVLDERYYPRELLDLKLQSLTTPNSNNIYVSKLGSDTIGNGSFGLPYLSLKKAIDSITNASNINRYTILIQSGRFTEVDDLTFKDFVSIKGISKESTIVTKLNNAPIEYYPSNTSMMFKDLTFGGNGIHIIKNGLLRSDIKFESCQIEGYGILKYIGSNDDINISRDYLSVSQTCKFPHIFTENVNFTCHHTIVDKTVTLRGYMNSYLLGVHIGQTLTIDSMGISDDSLSKLYIDNPSMPDGLNKLILIGTTELHKHVIYLDRASGIFYNPENNKVITNKNVQDAVKTLDSYAHVENTDKYLTTQRTTVVYVDNNRMDIYEQNGSITRPFKTIQQALTIADNRTSIHIAPGLYTEDLTCYNSTDLRGMGIRKVTIVGTVILQNQYNYLENIHINGNLYINDISRIYKCDITGVTHMNIQNSYGYAEIHESILLSNSEHPPLKVHSFSTLTIFNSKISAINSNTSTVDHSYGVLRLFNTYLYNNTPGKPVIDSHLDSIISVLKIYNCEVIHELASEDNDAIKALNTADNNTPNILSNVICNGNVRTELTYTMIDGLIFHLYGFLYGEHHFFRGSNMIKNESLLPGQTITDSLNFISNRSGFTRPATPTPGMPFFDMNLQRPIWWNSIINAWVDVHGSIK